MLVQICPIEVPESMTILWKMGRNPIQQNSNSCLMAAINEGTEFFWCSKATRRCKIAHNLIAPRSIKWVLGERHQLNMGIAHILNIRNQACSQLFLCEIAIVLLGHTHPRTQVNFIDRNRRFQPIPLWPSLHPELIVPFVAVLVVNY